MEEGKARGSLTLKGFKKEVELNGMKHVVKVIDGGAEFEESKSGKLLLRIRITADVGDVKSEYTITYGKYGSNNAAKGFAYASAEAPGGREADAERFSVLVKALMGREPGVYHMKDGKIIIKCYEGHLEGFMRFAELADAITKWLGETGR